MIGRFTRSAAMFTQLTLTEVLEGWYPEDHPEVVEMIRDLAKALLADDDRLLADAQPPAKV